MYAGEVELPRAVAFENPEIPGWAREGDWQDHRRPAFEAAYVHDATWYADGVMRVGAYVVAFAEQGEGREAVSFGNVLTGASAAVVVGRQKLVVPTVAGASIPFLELEVSESGGARRLIWVGWRIAGSVTASDLEAKVFQLSGAVRGRHDAQALVLTAVCSGACDGARSVLSRFAGAAAPPLYEGAERAVLAGQIRPRP
jgi:EpsI family protein